MDESPTYRKVLGATLRPEGSLQPRVLAHAGPLIVVEDVHLSVTVVSRPSSTVPELHVGLRKNEWELTTAGVGIAVGALIGHLPGAIVGGVAAYAWGLWRYRQD